MFTTQDAHDIPDTRNSACSVGNVWVVRWAQPRRAGDWHDRLPSTSGPASSVGVAGSTIRVPWIMFIPHAKLNSPTLSGVNSRVAVPNAGSVFDAAKSANTTRDVQSPAS